MRRELAERKTREYIGASGIGSECHAYHALSMRGFQSDMPEPKLLRIFRDGHRIEAQVVEDLVAAGHTVEALDPSTGEQWEYTAFGGHFVCHLDGFITLAGTDKRRTLEVKSMNRALFQRFVKHGVAVSHPEYLDQVTAQLWLVRTCGAEVDECVFVAYCKDNSSYHIEIIPFDEKRALSICEERVVPALRDVSLRISDSERKFECTQCFKRTACWHTEKVLEKKCQHCSNSWPVTSGGFKKRWDCTMGNATNVCHNFIPFKVKPHG